jgi:orotidine-5'-phosphate decarboxylase
MTFIEKLFAASEKNRSWLCVGLDPDPGQMPGIGILEFNTAIIDATADLVCAYKPNLAFYEALGPEGLDILKKTIEHIPSNIPVIGDGKRGDIGNTAKAYARSLFQSLGVDAATVNPYLGTDSIEPFTEYKDKGVFILCRTSNPGAVDFQNVTDAQGRHLYELVAMKAVEWNRYGNIGLVVGATYPDELKTVRALCPSMPLLIPGIGTQGGDLAVTIRSGIDTNGRNAIINVSRQVIYASKGGDFAEAARVSAERLRNEINGLIKQVQQ